MRRSALKAFLGAIAILAVIVGIGAALVRREDYTEFVEQSIRAHAESHGVRLSTRQLAIHGIGLSASEVDIFIVRALFGLRLQRVRIDAEVLSPRLTFASTAYGGALTGRASGSWFSEERTAEAVFDRIDLGQHPQINAFGFVHGFLSGAVRNITIEGATPVRAAFDIAIDDLSKPEKTNLRPGQLGIPFGFTLPVVTELSLKAHGSLDGGRISLDKLNVTSSLGALAGTGSMPAAGSGPVVFDGVFTLTPVGSAAIGPFIMIAGQGAIPPDTTKFRLVLRGTTASPQVRVSRAG